jgi:hypothetical protein
MAKANKPSVGAVVPYPLPLLPEGNPVPPSPGVPAPKAVKREPVLRPLLITSVNADGTVNGQVFLEPEERGHHESFARNVKAAP